MLLDPIVKCPYDNHFIVKSRLQKHIVKCERRFPEHYKIMCPYNANHRLFKKELATHIITCPERNVLQSETYPEPRKHGVINFDLHSDISSTIDCTENWDLEDNDNFTIASEETFVATNSETPDVIVDPTRAPCDTPEFALETANEDREKIRAPRGFSEAMLREASEDSCIEDEESVISSMGIGRGKVTWNANKLKLIGLGRGRPLKM